MAALPSLQALGPLWGPRFFKQESKQYGVQSRLRFCVAARWMPDHVRHDGSPLHG